MLNYLSNDDVKETFRTRARMVSFIRNYLDSHDFIEVETPMMQPIAGGALARPFFTHHNALDIDLYLRIAPELYLKRLVVGGFERVYELNRNFRNEGVSTQHNPEFTMLELYMAYADYHVLMDMLEQMLRSLAEFSLGSAVVSYQGHGYDLSASFRRATIEQLVAENNPALAATRLRDIGTLRSYCQDLGLF